MFKNIISVVVSSITMFNERLRDLLLIYKVVSKTKNVIEIKAYLKNKLFLRKRVNRITWVSKSETMAF